MSKKNISQERIIQSFLASAFDKSAGATSLSDVADSLEIKKASLYNHFENRDEMYSATIEACAKEIGSVSFLQDKTLENLKNGKSNFTTVLKKLITRYFNLFENEPLFHMYVFTHTEQYFNLSAADIVKNQADKMSDEIKKMLDAFSEFGKLEKKSDKELKDYASALSSVILQQLDAYISIRKETVRQNPEAGSGSLFSLPTDTATLNRTLKVVEILVK